MSDFRATPDHHRRMLTRFMQAVGSGSREAVVALLREDATLWVDGGGKVRGAATRPLHGSDAVARFLIASTRYLPDGAAPEIAEVNGEPAIILRVAGGQIRMLGNPEKLRSLT